MAKKATELSGLHIRRLKHHVTASGEPRAKRYSVGGVSGLYIQCSPPSGSNRVGSKQWILRTLGVSNPCCRDENPELPFFRALWVSLRIWCHQFVGVLLVSDAAAKVSE